MVVLLPCLITWNPHTTKRDNWCWIAKRANRIDSIRHEGKRAADRRNPLSQWNKRGNTISCVSVSPGFHPYTGFRKKKKYWRFSVTLQLSVILCHTEKSELLSLKSMLMEVWLPPFCLFSIPLYPLASCSPSCSKTPQKKANSLTVKLVIHPCLYLFYILLLTMGYHQIILFF